MSEHGSARYCPSCGQDVGSENRFCSNCGYNLSVPPPGEGRVQTERVDVPPPTPTTTPAQEGLGGFLRSFGLGAGAFIGCVVAMFILFVGCSAFVVIAGSGGGG